MYDAMKRLEVQHLRRAGLGVDEVARHAEVSARTVERVSAEEPIKDVQAAEAAQRSDLGRPSKVDPFRDQITAWLAAEPELQGIAILQRLKDAGYRGGKSAVYGAVKELRGLPSKEGIVRFEAVAGEFSQHDFGEYTVRYQDQSRERIQFFASRLKFSRLMRVRLVGDQTTETVCHSLVDAFVYFGGMPLICVFDNPKTIVTRREGKRIQWQETFGHFAAECGFAPHACWPDRPREKGAVENLVGFVQTSFFKAFQFRDRRDLEEKLEEWHRWANDERLSRATGETPRARYMLEAPRLHPLQLDPSGWTLRTTRIVRTDGYVELDDRRYFAGFEHIGQPLTVRVSEREILLWAGTVHLATHPRVPLNGRYSILPEQRAQVLEKSGARPFVKRQLLADLCPAATWYMTELRHKRPDLWREDVDRIFALLEEHGEERVRDALVEAARAGTVGAEYLEALLLGRGRLEVRS
jgi:transposase